jgi:hypothetical protein
VRIDLDDSWAIELEVGCATLIEVGVIKDNPNSRFRPKPEDIGKKRDGRPRYYGGLKDALLGYAEHGFGSMKADAIPSTELELLLRRQDEIAARIEQVLGKPPTKKDIECSSPVKAPLSTSSPEPGSTISTTPTPETTKPSSENPPSADTTRTAKSSTPCTSPSVTPNIPTSPVAVS